MTKEQKAILRVCDALMSEYSCTLEYVLLLPNDVLKSLYIVMAERKKQEYEFLARIIAAGTNAGFSGKMKIIDKMFKGKNDVDESDAFSQIEAMRQLWIKMHPKKDPKIFDKKLKKGNIRF